MYDVKLLNWLANGETGISSKNIAFIVGFKIVPNNDSYFAPSDPSDFNRCLLLLNEVPELRKDLHELGDYSKHWKRIVDRWDDVEKSFLDEVGFNWCKAKSAPKTYKLMKEIYCGEY